MKKIFIILILIFIFPLFIVSLIKENEKYHFMKNQMIKVKIDNEIKKIPLEQYVIGVVAGEMPVSFEIEALKAQAVAARTYVLKKVDNKKEYDIDNTINNQVYLTNEQLKNNWKDKYNEYYNKIKYAVISTSGEYMTYNNQIITAFFFSSSNGKTENCEEVFMEKLPYLRSVSSSWDKESPSYNGEKIITLKDFYNKLDLKYDDILRINIKERTKSGNIKKIIINDKEYNGTDVRKKLELRSTDFTIKINNENVIIKTKGYGHGVGMSQYGANGMAKEGYKYDQILKHYYTNIKINKI